MDVRVDGGPQDGTILVTWIPVTLNTTSVRHVPVTGYAVFADGKRVTDVDSPSSDHALVDLGCIGHFNPKLITVRSKSGDLLSNDSSAVPIQASSRTRRQTRVMRHRFLLCRRAFSSFKNVVWPQPPLCDSDFFYVFSRATLAFATVQQAAMELVVEAVEAGAYPNHAIYVVFVTLRVNWSSILMMKI